MLRDCGFMYVQEAILSKRSSCKMAVHDYILPAVIFAALTNNAQGPEMDPE